MPFAEAGVRRQPRLMRNEERSRTRVNLAQNKNSLLHRLFEEVDRGRWLIADKHVVAEGIRGDLEISFQREGVSDPLSAVDAECRYRMRRGGIRGL